MKDAGGASWREPGKIKEREVQGSGQQVLQVRGSEHRAQKGPWRPGGLCRGTVGGEGGREVDWGRGSEVY